MNKYKIWIVNINPLNPKIIIQNELIGVFYNLEEAKEFINYKMNCCKQDYAIYDENNKNILYSTEG